MINIWSNIANSKPAKIFFIAGQSNAFGAGLSTGTPPPYFGKLVNIENTGKSAYIWNVSTQEWEILEFGVNQQAANASAWGQEMELGYRAVLKYITNIYIIKIAESSLGLAEDVSLSDWNPNSTNEWYDDLIIETNTALSKLNNLKYEIEFFWWLQGELDAGFLAKADLYNTNLRLLISSLRTDIDSDMNFVAGRLSTPSKTYEATIRSAFEDILSISSSNKVENGSLINLDDLTKAVDGVHYTGTSYNIIANRALDYINEAI